MLAVLIATYNLKNLFLNGEGVTKPVAEVRPLRRMLEQVNADVLLLQEVGSLASLRALNEGLPQAYAYADLVMGNSDRSIHLGVLSRYPVQLVSHRDAALLDEQGAPLHEFANEAAASRGVLTPLTFSRDLLRVDVLQYALPLSIFVVHLKSRTNRLWREI